MIMGGSNWKYLEAWCSDRGLMISETALRNHAKQHIKNYEPPKTNEIKDAPKPKEIGNIDADPTLVDFEEFLKDLDLDLNNSSDINIHIASCQKVTSKIFYKLSAIADAKLMDYSKGLTRYPAEQIKSLMIGHQLYFKSFGLQNVVDENAAIKCLESLGYEIIRR
jgi:hypothetical protein